MVFLCDVVDRNPACLDDSGDGDAKAGGLAVKAQAQMVHAVSLAEVPRITIIVGDSFGPTSFAMVRYTYHAFLVSSNSDIELALSVNVRIQHFRWPQQTKLTEVDVTCTLLAKDMHILVNY